MRVLFLYIHKEIGLADFICSCIFCFTIVKIVFRKFRPLYTLHCITKTRSIAIKTAYVGVIFLTELIGLRLFDDLFLTASNLPSHICITRIEYGGL
jgi:hypothetical protein